MMSGKEYTAEFDAPIEVAFGQWRYTYRILDGKGNPVPGTEHTDEACCSAEDAAEQAALQAEVAIDTLTERDRSGGGPTA
jgi:hypothetical protein